MTDGWNTAQGDILRLTAAAGLAGGPSNDYTVRHILGVIADLKQAEDENDRLRALFAGMGRCYQCGWKAGYGHDEKCAMTEGDTP